MNFEMEATNILVTKAYELAIEEKVQVLKNWIGMESLQLIKTFTHEEKEKCKIVKGFILVLSNKFKP